jgi:hypothetical protein
MDFCFTEDLGRIGDYHGRVITETHIKVRSRTEAARSWEDEAQRDMIYPKIVVRWLDRNQLPYDQLMENSKEKLNSPEMYGNTFHLIDATGVGLPTLDFARRRFHLPTIGIWITSGQQVSKTDYGYAVPKVELINALQLCLSSKILSFAQGLNKDHVAQLVHEFKTFKEKKTTTGKATWEAWREKDHDDLVLSLAINCWWVLKTQGIQLVRKKRRFKTKNDYDPLKYGL